jgi:hypothetical protein
MPEDLTNVMVDTGKLRLTNEELFGQKRPVEASWPPVANGG